ncbi:hypothetical protein AMECASPLE_020800 [Ameca splendens]|uniref:Secreted protein n=1 Tax=Ameca splendens TaxID=208324 RepID=A0ABV0ZP14_9TELE
MWSTTHVISIFGCWWVWVHVHVLSGCPARESKHDTDVAHAQQPGSNLVPPFLLQHWVKDCVTAEDLCMETWLLRR